MDGLHPMPPPTCVCMLQLRDHATNHANAGRNSGGFGQSEGNGQGSQRAANSRPSGLKVAREEASSASARKGAIYTQADATRTMAAAQIYKATLLEDQNMLLLMTKPDDIITTVAARVYMGLHRGMN